MSDSRVIITADAGRAVSEFRRFRQQAVDALEQVSSAGGIIGGVLGGIGASLSVAAFTGWIKGAIDATDAASDLSQRIGVSVEDLAGLELAFQMGGMEAGALEGAMTKLSKQIVDGNGAFSKLGISSKNLDGSFKSNKDMLYELADSFAGMEEGVEKVALAQEVFGKSGAAMLPLLNSGAEGLREMDQMARQLGLSLNEEAVEQAGAFNDTLDLLMLGTQGVARGVAAELLPTLSTLAGQFLKTATQGDTLKNTAQFLASGLKLLYTVGVGIVEVFSTVGKTIGAAGAQLVSLLQGDFKMAAEIGRQWQADIGESWASTARSIAAAWGESGDASVQQMATIVRHGTVVGQSAAEIAAETKKMNQEQQAQAKLLAELSGLTGTFAQDWEELSKAYAAGALSLDQLTKGQAELLAKQPAIKAANDAAAKAAADEKKLLDDAAAAVDRDVEAIVKQVDALELKVRTYGLLPEAITDVQIAELEASKQSLALTDAGVADIQRRIDALTKLRNAQAASSVKDAEIEAVKALAEEGKRMAETVEQSLTDALMRGFESGKGFGQNMVDTVKNMFNTLVLRPVISAVVNPAAGALTGMLGLSGTAAAATGGGGGSSALGSGLSLAGTLSGVSAGAMQTAGAFLTGQIGLGSTLSAGLSAIGTGTMSGITAGLSSVVGVLGPIALGIGAAVSIWKKLDTSGTYHTGGAAMSSSSGTSTVTARSLNMESIRSSADTQKMVEGLTQGIVGILDSTALAFGRTAGYTAATAFADDTSKDGAWGALLIQKAGQDVVDWQDTRGGGKWAPKTFADGEAGQEQYLAALSKSVRAALDGIGLPAWATSMLDGLGDGASIEQMAQVVAQVQATQAALEVMGEQLVGFSSLSDAAVSALIKAAGGIEGLAAGASTYYENFYSDAEKQAAAQKQLAEALAAVNLQVPTTRDGYRQLVEQQLALGESGAVAVAALFNAAGAFAQLNPVLEAAANAAATQPDPKVLEQRQDLQEELDLLTMSSADLLARQRAGLDESNHALFDQIQLLKSQKTAAEEAKVAAETLLGINQGYQDQIDELTKAMMSPAERRALEIAGMDASTVALYDRVQALQVEAAVLEQRRDLQGELDQLTMSSAELLVIQRAGLDESNRALFDQVQALKAQKAAVEDAKAAASALLGNVSAAFTTLQRVAARERSALQGSVDVHAAAVERLRSLAQLLDGTLDSMSTPEQLLAQRTAAQAQIRAALASAQAGNALPDADSLRNALSAVTRDASDQFSSYEDYLLDLYRTQSDIAALAGITDKTLSVEERSLRALEGQLERLDAIVEIGQAQIDALNGEATGRLTLSQAMEALALAIGAAKANPIAGGTSSITAAYEQALGRAPDAGGLAYWQDRLANGASQDAVVDAIKGSAEAQIRKLYGEVFDRGADAEGLNYWTGRLNSGVGLDAIRESFMSSDEAKKIRGYATGGDHGGGWRIVGEEGPELEATGASRIFNARQTKDMFSRLASPADNGVVLARAVSSLSAEVAQLRAENGMLRQEINAGLGAIALNTLNTADHLDAATRGEVPLATKVVKENE